MVTRHLTFAGLCLLTCAAARSASAQETVDLVVIATTDVHGRVTSWDYVKDEEAPWGLTRAATVVDSLRRTHPGRVVLVDAGDLIQGNPIAAYFASVRRADPNPVIDAFNALAYDAFTPGNHEFDFGLEFLARATDVATFPIVSANVYRMPRDTFAYMAYTVLSRGGVRVGITGLTTPGALWNPQSLEGRILVRPLRPAAEQAMELLEQEQVDLRIVLSHAGLQPGPSSAAILANLPINPHLVVVGRSHGQLTDSVINGVHFVQPQPWATSLAVAHIRLRRAGQRYEVARIRAEQVPLATVEPHPALRDRFSRWHEAVRLWAGGLLGNAEGDWSARYARAEDTPIIDFINETQQRAVGAELSATAVFDLESGFSPGPIRMRDIAGVYPYESTLKAVRISGATLKQYLEKSAEYFRTYRPGQPIIDERVPGINFDVVSGAEYTIDLSEPPGSRVKQLTYRGRLVQPTDTFTLALSSHRQEGGGGFDMLVDLPVIVDRSEKIRDLLAEAVRAKGLLQAESYRDSSWHIVPGEAAAGVRSEFTWAGPEGERTMLRVLAINDFHGALDPRRAAWTLGRRVGSAPALKSWVDSLSRECRCSDLRVDVGDQMYGAPISNFSYGRSVVDIFNSLGIAATVIGDQDFHWGIDTLRRRIRESRYEWLGANIELSERRARPEWAKEWAIIERHGLKIGIIGLSSPSTPMRTRSTNIAGLSFADGAETVSRVLPTVRSLGADFVIILAHSGAFCDPVGCTGELVDLAEGLDSGAVDLILGGHTRGGLVTEINGMHVVSAGSHGISVAVIDFVRVPGGRLHVRPRIETVWTDDVAPDRRVTEIVESYRSEAERLIGQTVARLKFTLVADGSEHRLGRLVADAYRNAARADFAIASNDDIRGGLPQGKVTYGHVYQVQPNGNNIVKLTVTGEVILACLEHIVAGDEPIAHVSGVDVEYDPSRPVGSRVRRARTRGGQDIRRNRDYTLAVTDLLAVGGSGFSMLGGRPSEITGIRDVEPLGVTDVEALTSYLSRLPQPAEAPPQPRLQSRR